MIIYQLPRAMEVQKRFTIQLLAPMIVQIAMGQATFSSSGEPLDNITDDCFPGLAYVAQYNACMCVNETLVKGSCAKQVKER